MAESFFKYKRYRIEDEQRYKLTSQWTDSSTVEMYNQKTLKEFVGTCSLDQFGPTLTDAIYAIAEAGGVVAHSYNVEESGPNPGDSGYVKIYQDKDHSQEVSELSYRHLFFTYYDYDLDRYRDLWLTPDMFYKLTRFIPDSSESYITTYSHARPDDTRESSIDLFLYPSDSSQGQDVLYSASYSTFGIQFANRNGGIVSSATRDEIGMLSGLTTNIQLKFNNVDDQLNDMSTRIDNISGQISGFFTLPENIQIKYDSDHKAYITLWDDEFAMDPQSTTYAWDGIQIWKMLANERYGVATVGYEGLHTLQNLTPQHYTSQIYCIDEDPDTPGRFGIKFERKNSSNQYEMWYLTSKGLYLSQFDDGYAYFEFKDMKQFHYFHQYDTDYVKTFISNPEYATPTTFRIPAAFTLEATALDDPSNILEQVDITTKGIDYYYGDTGMICVKREELGTLIRARSNIQDQIDALSNSISTLADRIRVLEENLSGLKVINN